MRGSKQTQAHGTRYHLRNLNWARMIITNGQGDDESAVKPVPTTRKDADKTRLEMHRKKTFCHRKLPRSLSKRRWGGVSFSR